MATVESTCCLLSAVSSSIDHPLDQLAPAEVSRASAVVRAYAAAAGVSGTLRFNTIMLKEPPKAALLAYEAGSRPRPERQALVWLTNPPKGDLYEAVVALGDSVQPAGSSSSMSSSRDVLRAWKLVPGVQPTVTPDDCNLAEEIIMADTRIQQLLAERYGVTDPALVVFDPWSLNGTPEEFKGRRLMQGFLYVRSSKTDNEYAHPLDLCPLVDLNLGKVVHIDMYSVQRARRRSTSITIQTWHRRPQARRGALTSSPSTSRNPRGPASASPATWCAGPSGVCAWASTRARAWCCTAWPTRTLGA